MTQKKVEQRKKARQRERAAAKHKKQRVRLWMAGTIAALIIIVLGFGIYHYASNGGEGLADGGRSTGTSGGSSSSQSGSNQSAAFDYSKQPVLGDPNAPVKIVEFGDFKCPVCRDFDQTIFPKVKKDFVQTGKAAYYFMDFPIIPGSLNAELAAESVYHRSPKLYWKYHEALYAHQQSEDKNWATINYLVQLAEREVPKINAGQLSQDIKKQTYLNAVQSDHEKGKQLGVQGTPTLFLNGKMLDWPTTSHYPKLKQAINEAYKKAVGSNG